MWAGTQDGLSRYDGRAFRTFRADARRPGALASGVARGGLWVSTGDGVCYYDPCTEHFGHVPTNSAANYFVNALLADHAGSVWIGTEDGL